MTARGNAIFLTSDSRSTTDATLPPVTSAQKLKMITPIRSWTG